MFNRNNSKSAVSKVEKEIGTLLQSGEIQIDSKAIAGASVAGFESIDETMVSDIDGVVAKLENAGLGKLLKEHGPSMTDEQVKSCMQSAALTFAVMMDQDSAANYMSAYVSPSKKGDADHTVAAHSVPVAAHEGFDESSFNSFRSASVIVSALSAARDAAEEALFPTNMLEADQYGLHMEVGVPHVLRPVARDKSGKGFTLNKTPLTQAIRDHELLDGEFTKLVPNGENVDARDAFVNDSVVANFDVKVGNTTVKTRPLVIGSEIDLMSLSSLNDGDVTRDYTDTLDPTLGLGDIWVQITNPAANSNAGVSRIVKVSTKGMATALFTRRMAGSSEDLQLNFNGKASIVIAKADHDALELGVQDNSDDAVAIKLALEAAGTASTETSTVKLASAGADVSGWKVETTAGVVSEKAADTVALDIAVIGFLPDARHRNTNMSNEGLIIDAQSTVKYLLPIVTGSPFKTAAPVGGKGNAATLETLLTAVSIQRKNKGITHLIETMELLEAAGGDLDLSGYAAGMLIERSYLAKGPTTIRNMVGVSTTSEGVDALRHAILNAAMAVSVEMARESGYRAGLEVANGPNQYEVVITTDEYIGALLNNARTAGTSSLGNGVKYSVNISCDKRVEEKAFITLRPAGAASDHPMNFGVRGFVAPAVMTATASQGNGVTKQIVVQPRDTTHVTCPVLGVMDIGDLSGLFRTFAPLSTSQV